MKVMRHGKLFFDVTIDGKEVKQDEQSIYRFYSMTKVVASVAVLIAVERGRMALDDPVEKYIPEFRGCQVYAGGSVAAGDLRTEPASTMPTVRQCLTHTAGLGYGGLFAAFGLVDEVDKAYKQAGCGVDMLAGGMCKFESLEKLAATLAGCPLRHQPGTKFDYAMGHIIAGRCTEVALGATLTEIMQHEIFDPLEMNGAGWGVHESDPRVLPMYRYGETLLLA